MHSCVEGRLGRCSAWYALQLRAAFRTGKTTWGFVAVMRGHNEPDSSAKEIAFVARIGGHLGHGLRDTPQLGAQRLREFSAAELPS